MLQRSSPSKVTSDEKQAGGEFDAQLRRRCRHPKCGSKLAQPTDNSRHAFCSLGCYRSYYRNRCAVCEAQLPPGPSNRAICRRAECRAEMRKFPEAYLPSQTGERPPRSAHKSGLKTRSKPGRPTSLFGPLTWPANLIGGHRRGRRLDPNLVQSILNSEAPERRQS